jgi:ArsR family transcriptional regulator, arsenate/arsenite/antimonite-responsive transcriptional repressor
MDTSTILEATALEATGPGAIDAAAVDGFAALADPTRLAILRTLAAAPRCVCDLREAVPVAPNVLSYHLKVLRDAGLVTATRRGRWVDYALVPGALEALRAAVPALPDEESTPASCGARR